MRRRLLVGSIWCTMHAKARAPELAHRVARARLELGPMTSVVRGGRRFRIAPPITLVKEEIDQALEQTDKAIRKSLG